MQVILSGDADDGDDDGECITSQDSQTESAKLASTSQRSGMTVTETKAMKSRSFLSRIKVELVVFLGTISIAVRTITQQQLLQDKICLQKFKSPLDYCRELHDQPDSIFKDAILANYSAFFMMKEVIIMLPHVMSVLYIGSWCDRYPKGRRYCMIAGTASLLLEVTVMAVNSIFFDFSYVILLFSYLPSALMGSNFGLMITLYSYIVSYIHPKDRAYKLVLISVVLSFAQAIGIFVGGLILKTTPLFLFDQMRNYSGVFLMSGIAGIMMLILVICCMQEEPELMIDKKLEERMKEEKEEKKPLIFASYSRSQKVEKDLEIKYEKRNSCCEIFSLSHVWDIMQSVIRKRKGGERKILILLILSIIPLTAPIFGKEAVVFPIVQKLYQWNSFDFSIVSTIGSMIHPLVTLVFMPLMFKILSASDLQVALIGALSYAIGNLFLGTFGQMSPIAYFVSLILTSFSALIGHGIRSHISRILPGNEVGKMFSLIAMFEALLPFTGSLIMSIILNASIQFYPALVFQFAAFSQTIGLALLVYVDLISISILTS